MKTDASAASQRLDKWLWYARAAKTRSLAARLVAAGHVRVNGARTDNPAKIVRFGDVLTISLDRAVLVWKIVDFGTRRGPYAEARQLYESLNGPGGAGPAGAVSGSAELLDGENIGDS